MERTEVACIHGALDYILNYCMLRTAQKRRQLASFQKALGAEKQKHHAV